MATAASTATNSQKGTGPIVMSALAKTHMENEAPKYKITQEEEALIGKTSENLRPFFKRIIGLFSLPNAKPSRSKLYHVIQRAAKPEDVDAVHYVLKKFNDIYITYDKNVVNCYLLSCVSLGRSELAVEALKHRWHFRMFPTKRTLHRVLSALAAEPSKAVDAWMAIHQGKYEVGPQHLYLLLKSLEPTDAVDEAVAVVAASTPYAIKGFPTAWESRACFNILIHMLFRASRLDDCIKQLEAMGALGIAPGWHTHQLRLRVLAKQDNVAAAAAQLQAMVTLAHGAPSRETLGIGGGVAKHPWPECVAELLEKLPADVASAIEPHKAAILAGVRPDPHMYGEIRQSDGRGGEPTPPKAAAKGAGKPAAKAEAKPAAAKAEAKPAGKAEAKPEAKAAVKDAKKDGKDDKAGKAEGKKESAKK